MGSSKRHDYDGAFQHIFNRGARRDLIFFDDVDRRRWLAILVNVCGKRGVEIHAFCLMGNHFHLILRSRGNIDDVMRDTCSRYVKAFNRRHGFDGPLHGSPYRNELVESDEYFLTVSRYIHRNPVDIHDGPLDRYQWSSYRYFLSPASAPSWLTTDRTLNLFDDNCDRYRQFVGDDERPGHARWVPDVNLSFGPTVSLQTIIEVVASLAKVKPSAIVAGRAGIRSPARLAVCLLAEELGITPETTAEALRYSSPSSLRSSLHRGRKILETDAGFRGLLQVALGRLTGEDDDAEAA